MAQIAYRFEIKEGGWAPEDPHFTAWHRKFDADAQAELFARSLSEDYGNCLVYITRGGVRWHVWSGYLPRRGETEKSA